MIKKTTKMMLAAALSAAIGNTAVAQESRAFSEFELSYTGVNETMWSDIGLGFDDSYNIGIAIVFPAEKLVNYVGCELTILRFGWNTNTYYPEAECFVRNSLDGDNLAEVVATFEQTEADAANWSGTWNDVELPESLVIEEGKDLVIGYYLETEATNPWESSIPFSSLSTYYEDTQYIINYSVPVSEGGGEWQQLYDDYHDRPTSPIFASAILVDKSGQIIDLLEVLGVYTQPILSTEHATQGVAMLANRGTNDIDNITIQYQYGDNTATEEVALASRLVSGEVMTFGIPFHAFGTGKHTLEVVAANGNANSISAPVEYEVVGVPQEIAQEYVMTPLLEYFCSEDNHNSIRYYEDIIVPGFEENGDKIVKVNQHLDDQFSHSDPAAGNEYDDATTMLIDYCDGDLYGVYVPAMVVNRTAYPNPYVAMSMPDKPAEPVIYPMFVNEILYNPALATPTFASVDATLEGHAVADEYSIKVNTKVSEQVLPEGEQLYLTVYLMEDEVYSTTQEMPDDPDFTERFPDGVYYQRNVIRATLTPMYGSAVDFGENSYEFSGRVKQDWNKDKMSVISILSRSADNDRYNRNVINTCQSAMKINGGVADQISGETKDVRMYNLNGVEVDAHSAAPGVYIIKETSADGSVKARKIVR